MREREKKRTRGWKECEKEKIDGKEGKKKSEGESTNEKQDER